MKFPRIFYRPLIGLFFLSSLSCYTPSPLKVISISFKELQRKILKTSDWLFLVYIAADNDLDYFACRNLEEMKLIGSNENVTIIVQLDRYGANEHTKRIYITKEAIYQMNSNDISSKEKLNSGSAQTLIDFFDWATSHFAAKKILLSLWNHGSGILDSIRSKTTNASELFTFNPANHMLELDRSIGFLEIMGEKPLPKDHRGVCFSDTYGSYLTNQKLDYALKSIVEKRPNKKKIDIIAFDACLMSMVEVGGLIAPYADYMVGSQEVELGTGWPYHLVLAPFLEKSFSPEEFSKHITQAYKHGYSPITKDFTQSAIKLEKITLLEENIDAVSTLLLEMLCHQREYSVRKVIKASRSRQICTCFAEPSYIDLHHFYTNLIQMSSFILLAPGKESLVKELSALINEGFEIIEKTVVANVVGKNLQKAKGLSVYFPIRYIDSSYSKTPFACNTQWPNLLSALL